MANEVNDSVSGCKVGNDRFFCVNCRLPVRGAVVA